jgi:uncharacterized protein
MLNLKPIVHRILENYTLPWDGIHGVSHWARVLENGLRLAQVTDANIAVVQLFAVFHDSCRVNEAVDPGHGQRGADLAAEIRGNLFNLPDADFRLLYDACVGHTNGGTDAHITIQTCWDADRLDLGRVGMVPEPTKLCTPAAKSPDTLKWADGRGAFQTIPEIINGEWGIDTRDWDRTVR